MNSGRKNKQSDNDDYLRYLEILNIDKEKPSLKYLRKIVTAHLAKIPFENVSKLYYLRKYGLKNIPSLSLYLDGIKKYNFGGTCYSNNYYLNQLLKYLDYDVSLCGAAMKNPNSHMVNFVKTEGREFYIDAGYGAPFMEPLPADLSKDVVINSGTEKFVLNPKDQDGNSRMILFRDGVPRHGYLANPMLRQFEDFSQVITNSFHPESTFMNCILLVRFEDNASQLINNMTYTETKAGQVISTQLESKDELFITIHKSFQILPWISRIALENVKLSQDAWN